MIEITILKLDSMRWCLYLCVLRNVPQSDHGYLNSCADFEWLKLRVQVQWHSDRSNISWRSLGFHRLGKRKIPIPNAQ